jgi:hypothetical protein
MKIYFSWPDGYGRWERGCGKQNSQQAFFTLQGLRERFENVEWLPWGKKATDGDWLVCHHSWPIGEGDSHNQIQDFTQRGGKYLMIMNDPLLPYTASSGRYDRHGYDGILPGQAKVDFQTNGYLHCLLREMKLADAVLCHANELTVRKWLTNHPDILEWKRITSDFDFVPHVSPIHKESFPRRVFASSKKNFVILSGTDLRKNSAGVRRLGLPNIIEFGNASWRDESTLTRIFANCSFLVSPSLQEACQYWLHEGMCRGLLGIGGEDWWDGYGYEELIWRQSFDRSTDAENKEKLLFLASDSPRVEYIYQDVIAQFFTRTDNNWKSWMDVIEQKIRK